MTPQDARELNGRTAKRFVWTISEHQFLVTAEDEQGNAYLMAESSNMSTFCKCMSQMMRLAGHPDCEFMVIPKEVQ